MNSTEGAIKAAFLYKFCFYVEWPISYLRRAEDPIVFGVAGSQEFTDELTKTLKNHTVNDHPLQVKTISSSADLAGLHVLYVAKTQETLLQSFLEHTSGQPLLFVTESPTALDEGSGINFLVQDERVRFDVNLVATSQRDLHLSAQLLKVARTVREVPTQ